MEVHHEPRPFHGWREFLKEYGIIVLGVLTALLAEQAVQSLEWRHKVRAAIDDMKQELGNADGPEAYARLAIRDCVASRLAAVRTAVEQGERAASRRQIEALWLPKRTYDAFARDSAVASDVASHMPAVTMFSFRIVYSLIPEMNHLQDAELADLSRLRALPASGGALTQAEKLAETGAIEALELDNERMGRAAAFTLLHMRDVKVGLGPHMLGRDVGEARAHYDGCMARDVGPLVAGRQSDR
jgi:hypothetical protein